MYEDFVNVLSQVDVLLMLEVYSAGETPVSGADSRSLCRSIRQRGQIDPIYVATVDDMPEVLESVLAAGELLLTQGAGNIGALAKNIATEVLSNEG